MEWLKLLFTPRIERPLLPYFLFRLEDGLVGLPLRSSSQLPISFSRVAWSILDCARRTSTFLSCAFREQEDGKATLPILFIVRALRTRRVLGTLPAEPCRYHVPAQQAAEPGDSRPV